MKAILIVLGVALVPPLIVFMFLSGKQEKMMWMVLSFLYFYSLFRFVFKDPNPIIWSITLFMLMIFSISWYKDFKRDGLFNGIDIKNENCEVNRYGVEVCN